ncbi:hypothetical protein ACA910_015191 [Epithemia clementina (nom. ined.)]
MGEVKQARNMYTLPMLTVFVLISTFTGGSVAFSFSITISARKLVHDVLRMSKHRTIGVPQSYVPKAAASRTGLRIQTCEKPVTLWPCSALSSDDETASADDDDDDDDEPDYKNEETLLKIHFATQPGVCLDEAADALSNFCQSFPFAAVLPVQPLQYLPTAERGVEVKFLRKKTMTKSGVDGGIRFFLSKLPGPYRESDDVKEASAVGELEITAKRNSKGQTVTKIISEKLVITAFVQSLTTAEESSTNKDLASLRSKVAVTSLFHKWM